MTLAKTKTKKDGLKERFNLTKLEKMSKKTRGKQTSNLD